MSWSVNYLDTKADNMFDIKKKSISEGYKSFLLWSMENEVLFGDVATAADLTSYLSYLAGILLWG